MFKQILPANAIRSLQKIWTVSEENSEENLHEDIGAFKG